MYLSKVTLLAFTLFAEISGKRSKSSSKSSSKSETAKSCKRCTRRPVFGAVFSMTNGYTTNEILMYSRDKTGHLEFVNQTDTGGFGGNNLMTASDDPLGSQNPIIVAGNCLLAVSSGSNNVTSFEIESERSIRRESIVGSGGTTPISLTEYGGFVYVLNAEDGGSIQGFNLDPLSCGLSSIMGSSHSLDQKPVFYPDGNDPPLSELSNNKPVLAAPTQISFTPDGDALIVAIKGIRGHAVAFGGSFLQFSVPSTGVAEFFISNLIGLDSVLPFSFDFDDDENLLLVDAFGEGPFGGGDGASVISHKVRKTVNREISRIDRITLVNQTAACWIKYNNGCAYTTNSVTHSVSGLSVDDGQLSDSIVASPQGNDTPLNNPLDLNFSRDGFLYVLSTNSGQGAPADPPLIVNRPQIHVYERNELFLGLDCTLTEIQVINDGIPTEEQNAGPTPARNGAGTVGIAVY